MLGQCGNLETLSLDLYLDDSYWNAIKEVCLPLLTTIDLHESPVFVRHLPTAALNWPKLKSFNLHSCDMKGDLVDLCSCAFSELEYLDLSDGDGLFTAAAIRALQTALGTGRWGRMKKLAVYTGYVHIHDLLNTEYTFPNLEEIDVYTEHGDISYLEYRDVQALAKAGRENRLPRFAALNFDILHEETDEDVNATWLAVMEVLETPWPHLRYLRVHAEHPCPVIVGRRIMELLNDAHTPRLTELDIDASLQELVWFLINHEPLHSLEKLTLDTTFMDMPRRILWERGPSTFPALKELTVKGTRWPYEDFEKLIGAPWRQPVRIRCLVIRQYDVFTM